MSQLESLGLRYEPGCLQLLDQQLLPHEEHWFVVTTPEEMITAIKKLKVRGAPLIGVAAALILAEYSRGTISLSEFEQAAESLRQSRPTAINLMWAIDRMLAAAATDMTSKNLVREAVAIFTEDAELCDRIAEAGAEKIKDGDGVLTHCNTGGLATAGVGTALGVIRKAFEQGKKIHVYVDETRPLLQGGRLTTWELEKLGVPYTLICDNMAASVMSQGNVQSAIVGSDRIATNGDFANKIGTFSVAILCQYHQIPFYVAAPYSTVDKFCEGAKGIPIEERAASEVRGVAGSFGEVCWAPRSSKTYNPAFDVTPAELVTGWMLDSGYLSIEDIKNGVLRES